MGDYRANVTDTQQNVLEAAQFEAGVPVFEDHKTRVIARGAQTATQRAAHGAAIRNNAGVIMPWADVPGRFVETQIGKA